MEWGKVKNIILVVLLLVNGFLLVLVGAQRGETRRYEQSALAQSIQVLANNGIQVSEADIAPAEHLWPQSAERDLQAEQRLAQALLGEDVSGVNRGGGLYTYRGQRGLVNLRGGGELSAQLEEDGRWQTDDPQAHAAGLLRELDIDAELLETQLSGGAGTVRFRQLWDDAPLFSNELTFTYEGGHLRELSGTLLAANSTSREEGQALSLPTALTRFLDNVLVSGDVCSTISSMEPGYRSTQSFSGAVSLTPVWLIATNTADYYLDAVTGDLTRAAIR